MVDIAKKLLKGNELTFKLWSGRLQYLFPNASEIGDLNHREAKIFPQ